MSTSARTSVQPAFGLKLPERYRVKRHIATGGMASVWCAEDRVLGRSVAIKVLSDRFAHDEFAVRRFKREARAAARVSNHQHVVTIYDVGDIAPEGPEMTPRAFIVMEYLAGGTVADAMHADSVGPGDARRWISEASSALDHAHERGIVHRDIKPANFLLDRGRGLHVADFGIAHLQSEDTITSTGQLFGTAAYLAPEQALGQEANSASDRYALAVAAFELLTGGRPFTATHFAAQARQHIEDEPPRATDRDPSLPPAVDGVLARGMAKAPEDRYPTAAAFTQELEAALDSQPTAATEAVTAPAERQPGRRPGAGALAAGGLAAGAAAADAADAGTQRIARRPPAASSRPAASARGGAAPRGPRSDPRPRPGQAERPPRRGLVLAALGLAALGVIILLATMSSGNGSTNAAHHSAARSAASSHRRATHRSAASHSSTVAQSSSRAAAGPTSTPSTTPASADASALQAQGHQQMLDGNYGTAIATLRRAVASASPGSLTYAYALYDLGHALMLSGNPQAAIPVLEQRLKIPNQTPVVQALLNQALQEAGQSPKPGPRASPGPNSGGAALPPGQQPGHGHGSGKGPGG